MTECKACGRPLDDPVSVQLGIGPTCFEQNPRRYLVGYAKEVVITLQDNPGRWARVFEGLPDSRSASRWTNALRAVGNLEVGYRARPGDEGPYAVYARWTETVSGDEIG